MYPWRFVVRSGSSCEKRGIGRRHYKELPTIDQCDLALHLLDLDTGPIKGGRISFEGELSLQDRVVTADSPLSH